MKTPAEAENLAKLVTAHAFSSHGAEFGIMTAEEFEVRARETLVRPTAVRMLANGTIAYWNDGDQMVLIENARAPERSTAFRPTSGKAYFENLR